MTLIILGDTHGCVRHVEVLYRYFSDNGYLNDYRLAFVGDYCNRGAFSNQLIDLCVDLQAEGHVFIAGNHEYVLREALNDANPEQDEWRQHWLDKYESQFISSYSVNRYDPAYFSSNGSIMAALEAAMPSSHVAFLRGLPLYYETKDEILIHAGVSPLSSWESQKKILALDHEFNSWPATIFSQHLAGLKLHSAHDKRVISGHVPRANPYVDIHRAMLDSGIENSHKLWALISDTGEVFECSQAKDNSFDVSIIP